MSEEILQQEEVDPEAEDFKSDPRIEEPPDQELDEESLDEILAEDQLIEDEFLASDDEDEEEEEIDLTPEPSTELAAELNGASVDSSAESDDEIKATQDELKPVIEALLFVADEPLQFKQLCKILGDAPVEDVTSALGETGR